MIVIKTRNVNTALRDGHKVLTELGEWRASRNGPVLVAPEPVTTVFEHPRECVMLHPERDANPFFHLVEAMWMLAGRHDLKVLTPYVKRMAEFSDDGGVTQPGAYGFRWRHQFDYRRGRELDQLDWAIRRLRRDKDDRRVVIQMWDPAADAYAADSDGRDVPCNLCALPSVASDSRLDLTVYNRSNDMIWGAYGANAVHFSYLHHALATSLGLRQGSLRLVSNNFHAYEATLGRANHPWPWGWNEDEQCPRPDPYEAGHTTSFPMWDFLSDPSWDLNYFTASANLLLDCQDRIQDIDGAPYRFLREMVLPMMRSHAAWRDGEAELARQELVAMPPRSDWRRAAEMWIDRRTQK